MRDERPPLACPDLGKKGPNCVHHWIESSIQNIVLRVSRIKAPTFSPVESFFFCFSFFVCVYRSVLIPQNFIALKNIWLRAWC